MSPANESDRLSSTLILRLAEWRCKHDDRLKVKVRSRSGLPTPRPPEVDGQLELWDGGAA